MAPDIIWTVGKYFVFVVLVAIPLAMHRDEIPARVVDLLDGRHGALFAPIVIAIMAVTGSLALVLADHIQILHWGWLGENIAAAPLSDTTDSAASDGGTSVVDVFSIAVTAGILLLAILIFNYYEELLFRDSWTDVGKWAVIHLLMGIPLFSVIPIFSAGVIYKIIFDRYGLNTAYAAHFATNSMVISLMLIASAMVG